MFCGSSNWLTGLSSTGIDIVNIANNHNLDATISGLTETTNLLAQAGFMVTDHQPVYKSVKGTNFAFLGFNDISRIPPDPEIAQQIPQARSNSDIVVVQFHWGHEYTHQVSSRQKSLAHQAIDLGADVVIGNHPHWPQPIELYKGKPILYSHGNFIFDQYWSTRTRQGLVSRLTFYDKSLVDIELIPIQIDPTGQPSLATPEVAEQILSDIRPLSVE